MPYCKLLSASISVTTCNLFRIKETDYSFRNALKVIQPKKKGTTYGLRSLAYTGAKMWNDQAITINEDSTLSTFKIFVNDLDIKLDPDYNSYI